MVVNARPLKRMKSCVMTDLCDFLNFPSQSPGNFRTKIRGFLAKHAMLPPPSSLFPHLLTWQVQFRFSDDTTDVAASLSEIICLDVVEEDVTRSRSIYCDQCRVVGWSGHPVCGKRYHFIIKADGNSIGGYHKPCICCGDVLHLSDSKCKSCNLETSTDDVEDWVYSQLENTTHLLHGVIHSNGYGHLLRVNGREGGSRILSGTQIMDFWDRLCKVLGARKISVMDVSKKYGLEYRLLHSIIKGYPWYGNWGYEFGAGSFALTAEAYKTSVDNLSNLPLSVFLSQDQKKPASPLADVISRYQSASQHDLVSVGDLFRFVLGLLHDARKEIFFKAEQQNLGASGALSSYSRWDVERVNKSMFRVLRAVSRPNWVSFRSLKGAVCKVGPTELLDYCLQELAGKTAFDGTAVAARLNPDSRAFEYRLEGQEIENHGSCVQSEEGLLRDLRYMYECILHPRTMLDFLSQPATDSAEKLLDCKQFVKNYNPQNALPPQQTPSSVSIWCEAELVDEVDEITTTPPPELVVLPPNATLSDLKLEASKAFQDVYVIFKRFSADELVDFGGVDQSMKVNSVVGPGGAVVRVKGRCHVKHGLHRFRMERGVERWTVDCLCGAKDDDGERMSACDNCSVWQHTRCSGIPDTESVPARFVCYKCRARTPCKDEARDGLVNGLTAPDVAL